MQISFVLCKNVNKLLLLTDYSALKITPAKTDLFLTNKTAA